MVPGFFLFSLFIINFMTLWGLGTLIMGRTIGQALRLHRFSIHIGFRFHAAVRNFGLCPLNETKEIIFYGKLHYRNRILLFTDQHSKSNDNPLVLHAKKRDNRKSFL